MPLPFKLSRTIRRLRFVLRTPRTQRGGIAPFAIVVLTGALAATAYAVDVVRLTSDASQLKRATDAAAMALGREYVLQKDDFSDTRAALAEGYVRENLGLDSALRNGLTKVTVTQSGSDRGSALLTVEATFTGTPILSTFDQPDVTVHSTAEVRVTSTEVALVLPNTNTEDAASLAALRRLARQFARDLVESNDSTWLALVPFSQAVNVYDPDHPDRLRTWATSDALRPVELTSLFSSGYGSLADRRIPDRKANLLCLYRGLYLGENYFWDQAPTGRFHVYYRADLPANGSPGATPIAWYGPNPNLGEAMGTNDTRYMVADKGCPNAALLPLTNDLDKIDRRLAKMSTRFNMNLAIPLGWAGMALAPAFRGDAGWGDPDLPKDFDLDGTKNRIKAIVVLVNTEGDWFDTDGYNAYVGEAIEGQDGTGTQSARDIAQERLIRLCRSFRAHNLNVYVIAAEADDDPSADTTTFRTDATPGLTVCTNGGKNLHFLWQQNFQQAESRISRLLDDIVEDLRQQGGFIRLIE